MMELGLLKDSIKHSDSFEYDTYRKCFLDINKIIDYTCKVYYDWDDYCWIEKLRYLNKRNKKLGKIC